MENGETLRDSKEDIAYIKKYGVKKMRIFGFVVREKRLKSE